MIADLLAVHYGDFHNALRTGARWALGLHIDTVREHRFKLRQKLAARSTHHAVAIALMRGLI